MAQKGYSAMILLDEPYASEPLIEWMESSQHPVLSNPFTQNISEAYKLNLVDSHQALDSINKGERVYSNSENILDWILTNSSNDNLCDTIRIFKDKGEMRRRLAPLSPAFYFATYTRDELTALDASALPLPVVLKPEVGFCSMGVYVIHDENEWNAALVDLDREKATWNAMYPESVIDSSAYIIESYISGTEFALDAYFDEAGHACILNVLRHDFASEEDTSDRMYVTSLELIDQWRSPFTQWLNEVNNLVGAINFPFHAELRVLPDGSIIPIEFNPLRFAGLGGTDVAYYGFGYRTYQAFLENAQPDFEALAAEHAGNTYSMSLLNPPAGITGEEAFNYEAFLSRFSDVLCMRRFGVNRVGNYGFLFLKTTKETAGELDYLLTDDLREFLE